MPDFILKYRKFDLSWAPHQTPLGSLQRLQLDLRGLVLRGRDGKKGKGGELPLLVS